MVSVKKTVVVDGTEYVLNKLSINDLATLADKICAKREQDIKAIAKEEKVDKNDLFNMLVKCRTNKPSIGEIVGLCSTPAVCSNIIEIACKNSNIDVEIIKSISPLELMNIGQALILDETFMDETTAEADKIKEKEDKESPKP